MNWFERERIRWIDETIRVFGEIKPKHLMVKFGISQTSASSDFRRYKKLRGDKVVYDASAKIYRNPAYEELEA